MHKAGNNDKVKDHTENPISKNRAMHNWPVNSQISIILHLWKK
jgi:hypothetical protein